MFKGKTRDRPNIQESRNRTYAAKLKRAKKLSQISKILVIVAALVTLGLTFLPVINFLALGFLPVIPVVTITILAYGFQIYAVGFADAEKYIMYDVKLRSSPTQPPQTQKKQ